MSLFNTPYGTMIAVQEADGLRFVAAAYATPNARTEPTIEMFRNLLSDESAPASHDPCRRRVLLIQYDDRNYHDIGSVGYCRPCGGSPAVQLVPDTFFFLSRGYQSLRELATVGELPPWEARQDTVFWRGSATHNGFALDGSPIQRLEQIPRVALCRALRGHAGTDVAIMAPWEFDQPWEEMIEYYTREGVYGPPVAMNQHANYRYLIHIHGVACSASLFEKLLLGSCILIVGSPFEAWFYRGLVEWRHFVPVRADFSDVLTRIEWCREHPSEARAIAEEGQRYALDHTFETARAMAIEAIGRSILVLDR